MPLGERGEDQKVNIFQLLIVDRTSVTPISVVPTKLAYQEKFTLNLVLIFLENISVVSSIMVEKSNAAH